MSAVVVAAASCVTAGPDGVRVRLVEGIVWDADHPMVRFRPDLFRPLNVSTVEQASSAPGEVRRGPGRPRKVADK